MKVEEIAHQAADAARASVSHMEHAPIGRGSLQRGRAPLVLAVAAIAMVASFGVWFAARGAGAGDGQEQVVAATTGEVGPWELDVVPAGFEVSLAYDGLPAHDLVDLDDLPRLSYFGDAASRRPFSERDLLVVLLPNDQSFGNVEQDAGPIDVRGVEGRIMGDTTVPGTSGISWLESGSPATSITLFSRNFGLEELIRIAEAMEIDNVRVALNSIDNLDLIQSQTFTGSSASSGSTIMYTTATPASTGIGLTTRAGDFDELSAFLRWWDPGVQELEINARSALLGAVREEGPVEFATPTLVWTPADGVVVTLFVEGDPVPELDLVALAESAHPVDAETWAEYLAMEGEDIDSEVGAQPEFDEEAEGSEAAPSSLQADVANEASQFDNIYARGAGAPGGVQYGWVLGTKGAELCMFFQAGLGGDGSCWPLSETIDVIIGESPGIAIVDSFDDSDFSVVLLASDLAVHGLREANAVGITTTLEADEYRWYVWVGPSSMSPVFNVIVDGEVVGQLDVGNN